MSSHRKNSAPPNRARLSSVDRDSVKRSAIDNITRVLEELLPGGAVRGAEYVVRNPTRADKSPGSFSVRIAGPKAGVWSDFATRDRGGDPVSLVAYVKKCSDDAAERWLQGFLSKRIAARKSEAISSTRDSDHVSGARSTQSTGPRPAIDIETLPAPENAERVLPALARLGKRKPDSHWLYQTADYLRAFYIVRWDEPDGSKTIRPVSWWRSAQGEGWRIKAWPNARPLYNLPRIVMRPTASILLCEGEKAADAVERLFGRNVVTTTSSGGAGAVARTDWSPLKGRKVWIWPDADAPGLKYADDVAQRLSELGCAVSIVDAMALASITPAGAKRVPKEGWDAADVTEEWKDLEALRTTLRGLAKPFDPGPGYVSYGPFEMTAKGLTIRAPSKHSTKSEASGPESVWICSAFEVAAKSRDPSGKNWGKWIRFVDSDGRVHQRHVPDADTQGDPAVLCRPLADEGLTISPHRQRQLLAYLAGVRSKRRATVVQRTGWHEVGDHLCFVLPNRIIGPKGAEFVILDAIAVGPYGAHGSLEDWQNSVGEPAGQHFLATLAVSTALAGPLLYPANQEGGGLNFFGVSSRGKTTIIQAAASVWGRGSSSGGYVRGWRATANGLEGAAASATDTLLVLDELGVLESREAGAAIYALASGEGKARMARDASLRETKTWRVLVLSTGEVPMEVKVAEDKGRKARAGQTVRMLDIDADRGKGFGAFSHTGSESSAAVLADTLKLAAKTNYGTAGPEFVRRLVRYGVAKAGAAANVRIKKFVAKETQEGDDGQVVRTAGKFGHIAAAGELATELGVTPWKKGMSTQAAAWAFRHWVKGRGGVEAAEVRQAILQVRLFIEQHGESRFDPLGEPSARPVNDRAGWRTGSGLNQEWWIPPETWKAEVCAGLDPKLVARTLGERQMLKRAKDGFQSVVKIHGASRRVYIVTARIFAGSQEKAR